MLEAAGAREEHRKAEYERSQQKSLAEQHLENVASGKGKGPADSDPKQNFSKGRLGEGDEIALDKDRLKAAIAAEKKRKGVTDDDEAWNQAKRSKTDVTEEDMGKLTLHNTSNDRTCLITILSHFRGISIDPYSSVRRPHGQLQRRRPLAAITIACSATYLSPMTLYHLTIVVYLPSTSMQSRLTCLTSSTQKAI